MKDPSESFEFSESETSEDTSLIMGFLERASTPLFNFPCLYSNLY